ncbi:MAG: signal recognition particle-docking protein FtsY [Clostridia bacterium]
MSFIKKMKKGLSKTRNSLAKKIYDTFLKYKYVSEELYEELEETLITSDISAELAFEFLDSLRERAHKDKIEDAQELYKALQSIIIDEIPEESELNINNELSVILLVGVNGVGKTTSAGKIAQMLKDKNKKVMLVAADTFRAAAAEQLSIWAERTNSLIVKHDAGGDPAAVIYDAIHSARAKGVDVLIVDTAGRLHNKKNLMNELAKINRVLSREIDGAPHETLLVIDATTGQNGLYQAEAFNEATDLTGMILTKMDGTAKGGIVFNISKNFGVPVKFIGVGEKVDDLIPFDKKDFIEALFEDVK